VIAALAQSGTPFSILTKGTLLGRDLPLLAEVGRQVKVAVAISLALLDPELHATLEPGTPTPQARLNLVRRIRAAGLSCGVLVAPILPHLTDSTEQLERLAAELSAAGASTISGIALHLRPGAREWFFGWLRREHPDLVPAYERLYARGAYVSKPYAEDLQRRLRMVMPGARPVRR
jgi:DNA repair photolyase